MSTTDSVPRTIVSPTRFPSKVFLSKRVNEPFPPLNLLLSAHDVARLTRRHRWLLFALTAVGRFPKQQRFRGHAIGWHRQDLAHWLESKRALKVRLHRRAKPNPATRPVPGPRRLTDRTVTQEIQQPVFVTPARYVLLPVANAITGYSVKAMERKIERGDWPEGKLWKRAPDGRILIVMMGYQKWVESR